MTTSLASIRLPAIAATVPHFELWTMWLLIAIGAVPVYRVYVGSRGERASAGLPR